MKDSGDSTQNMTSLSECITNALESGYSENFRVVSKGLTTDDGKSIYQPQDVAIVNFYRFEGYSNPSDNSILYLVETNDGLKGTLIDAYGVYAGADFSTFIRQVIDIHKQKEQTEV